MPSLIVKAAGPTGCVFCVGRVYFVEENGGVCHSLPLCDEFKQLEPADFLAASIEKLQAAQTLH